jgi:hypothetical protein
VAFLDRLYTAKRKVEERIVILGGEDESVCNLPSMYEWLTNPQFSKIKQLFKSLVPNLRFRCETFSEIPTLCLISWNSWIDEIVRCLFNSG